MVVAPILTNLEGLTPGQRAALAAEMLPQLQNQGLSVRAATALAAACACSSATNIHYAKTAKARDPALYRLIQDGTLNATEAYRRIKERPPIKPKGLKAQPLAQRLADIARLASEGNASDQIAEAIDLSQERVRELANKAGIRLADVVTGHRPKLKIHRVIEETVSTLEGLALGLRTIDGARLECEAEEARQWVNSIDASLRVIGRVRKILRRSYE